MVSFENTDIAFRHKTDKELKRAYLLFRLIGSNTLVSIGKGLSNFALKLRIPVGWAVKPTIFRQFCGGETILECGPRIRALGEYGIGTILDYSVEGKDAEEVFEHTAKELLKTVERAHNDSDIPFSVLKVSGIAPNRLLEKVSAGKELNEKESREFEQVKARLNRICEQAHSTGTPVFIDAEESWIQEAIDQMVTDMMRKYNKESAIIFNTAQMYRHDRLNFIKRSLDIAREEGFYLGMKLVRGAYMEKERERAQEKGYPSPIQPDKQSTDRDYDLALDFCIDNIDRVALCAGTHNEKSSLHLVQKMDEKGIQNNDPRIYFSQLLGMSDHISFNLAHAGYNVAKYVPYGPVQEVLPYLIRRTEENTSVAGQTGRELRLISEELQRRRTERSWAGAS